MSEYSKIYEAYKKIINEVEDEDINEDAKAFKKEMEQVKQFTFKAVNQMGGLKNDPKTALKNCKIAQKHLNAAITALSNI